MAVAAPVLDREYTLDHRYTRQQGRIYLSGIQALVRLPLLQAARDRAAGLNTAGFVSGYRGSPLGGLDLELWRAHEHLAAAGVQFKPGLNEDLAATMVWGSQQVGLFSGAQHDGVFAMWYGKGPGVDRSGDVFKHANAAGTSPHGGVLVLAGDDHACRSSTLPHGSELEFVSAMMPVLNPAGIQEILDFGLIGWAMSRWTGRWIGFKTIAETVESSASVELSSGPQIVLPEDFEPPPGGFNIRWPDPPLDQEARLHQWVVPATHAFARANGLDRVAISSPRPRLGIVTTGKSYLDVLQALEFLGIDAAMAAAMGLTVYKVGMVWPLEPEGLRYFCRGLQEVLVIEEKRAFLESQIKEILYDLPERPQVLGKHDEQGRLILPSTAELTPAQVAKVLAGRIGRFHRSESIERCLAFITEKESELALPRAEFPRAAHYCAGCPHNTSTAVPEGSRAMAGIGCHYMVTWMDRRTETFTHMGGEGVTWCGQAPFTDTAHVFQNLGDGTYFHSGSLAIRQSIIAGSNITYKILYNDAVAMTGGQPLDGHLGVPDIAAQVRAEGVRTIVVMSDNISKWERLRRHFPEGTRFVSRSKLEAIQKELREIKGVTVLIFEQTCAAEKRRRRKRGKLADPPKRVFINSLVCEGCGDCSAKSFCVAVVPKETEFGRKRAIDQSSCNKDYRCTEGFCPSFVTVHGGRPRKRQSVSPVDFESLPEPVADALERPWNILVTGIGGTGVVTIGALLGMAAHLEGRGGTVLDQTGLAQKGGAVTTHVRIAHQPDDIYAVRIAAGEVDLVLGCDMVVVNDYWSLSKIRSDRSHVLLNTHQVMPGTFVQQPDLEFPARQIVAAVRLALGGQNPEQVEATELAIALLGDAIGANLFMLGYAWQRGWIPLQLASLRRAIELNGVAVAMNQQALQWGRMAAHDPQAVHRAAYPDSQVGAAVAELDDSHLSPTLHDIIERRAAFLSDYQNQAYAGRYRQLLERVRSVEQKAVPGATALTEAVARYAFKLMAYKDEYEVARLYTSGSFERQLHEQFEGDIRLEFHLAPPLLARKDASGQLQKRSFGPWMMKAFRLLARLRFLRGTAFDVFSYSTERRADQQLIGQYLEIVQTLLGTLQPDKHMLAVTIASVPEQIRGYGHIKAADLAAAQRVWQQLLASYLP